MRIAEVLKTERKFLCINATIMISVQLVEEALKSAVPASLNNRLPHLLLLHHHPRLPRHQTTRYLSGRLLAIFPPSLKYFIKII